MATITTGLTITSAFGSWYVDDLPLRADQTTVNRYLVEKNYGTAGTFTADGGMWSNDGGRLMNYYGPTGEDLVSGTTMQWLNYFGYDAIVTSITT